MPEPDSQCDAMIVEMCSTPPIQIASSPRPIVQATIDNDLVPIPRLDHKAMREHAKRRKKNKKKGTLPAAPAANVIKGFQTPVLSGIEDSDYSFPSTPRFGATKTSSLTASPALGPSASQSGLSALKARLDALSLDGDELRPSLARVMSNTSIATDTATPSSRASDGDKAELETYSVTLGQDFISPDAGSDTPIFASHATEGGLCTRPASRKMCAADFTPLRCLGKGAFGTVHLVKQRATGRLYAQKQFKKASLTVHKRLVEQTRAERAILESVNRHPFVVKLFYAFQNEEKLYLILEYAQGGELFHHLAMERIFTEEVAAFYMAEIILALAHLHQNVRVIYRDLKPENCLLDSEGHLLLTDFGLSKVALEEERTNSVLGTIEYMAPEVVRGDAYDFAVDWWSLGAIAFDMMVGKPPFGGGNHAKIQQNIVKQKLQLPYFLGPDAKDLLTRLLRKEPGKRLSGTTPKDLKTLKGHRFFRKIDWKMLEMREVEPPILPVITDPELAENFDAEFTDLPLSPVFQRSSKFIETDVQIAQTMVDENDPFGGFSFVASNSLLESEEWMLGA